MSGHLRGLYLCVREGVVISGEQVSASKNLSIKNTKLTPEEFFESPIVNRFDRFFLSGDVDDTGLVCRARQYGVVKHKATYVCSPNILNSRKLRVVPERQLAAMHSFGWNLQPSQGGFDLIRPVQAIAFQLADQRKQLDNDTKALLRLLKDHPAWSAVSFIFGINLRHAASMLAAIRDPRFFVSVSRDSDSMIQINAFMGLTQKNVEYCLSDAATVCGPLSHTPKARCSYVVNSWRSAQEAVGERCNFLQVFKQLATASEPVELQVSKLWLKFVVDVWKSSLELARDRPQVKELGFDPEHFFRGHEKAASDYRLHLSNLEKVTNDRFT